MQQSSRIIVRGLRLVKEAEAIGLNEALSWVKGLGYSKILLISLRCVSGFCGGLLMSGIAGFVKLQDSSEFRISRSFSEAKDWRKLFATSPDQALEFYPPKIVDGKIVVVPVWVHLRNIPLELFTKAGLSYIASAIGSPLYMDRVSAYQQRLAYVKLCVEVDVNAEIPRFINVQMKNGQLVCPNQPNEVKVWVPKKKIDETVKERDVPEGAKQFDKDMAQGSYENMRDTEPKKEVDQSTSSVVCEKAISPKSATSSDKASSMNIFQILDTAVATDLMEEESRIVGDFKVAPRRPRAASAGVAKVMKSLKVNKKGPIDKGKKKVRWIQLSRVMLSHQLNEDLDRKKLWSHLGRVYQTTQNDPWMLTGDFNVTAQPWESSNYDGTQSNKHNEGFLARKLDRVMINDNWPSCFPTSSVEFLAPEVSDHCPSLIQLHQTSHPPPKPFRFFNF
ncbi:hypothetical protein DITRI_Ditri16bG0115700 [Diplodiscus trichospermus]